MNDRAILLDLIDRCSSPDLHARLRAEAVKLFATLDVANAERAQAAKWAAFWEHRWLMDRRPQ